MFAATVSSRITLMSWGAEVSSTSFAPDAVRTRESPPKYEPAEISPPNTRARPVAAIALVRLPPIA